MKKINEKKLWDNLDNKNKSYTTRVLNFFHYRRNKIGQSWKREEVLTWELIRALDILPRDYFLTELLNFLVKKNKKELTDIAVKLLEKPCDVEVIAYPKLNLPGNKKNSASDIEIFLDGFRLWIEAKTVIVKKDELLAQIKTQEKALQKMNGNKSCVIALVPQGQQTETTCFYWQDIKTIFETALQKMEETYKDDLNFIRGYKKLAEELIDRISSRFELT